jgi:S-adenosylmethionine hydrolase
MKPSPIISLTTDFGSKDWFVGTMKGVILGINPSALPVDICHEIAPGDIRAGAFTLAASCRFFPSGSVHLAVIDPGVGSARGMIAVKTADYVFVGPDNGVLSWALRQERIQSLHSLENKTYFLDGLSQTFHGRDIFAPVAAHLTRGIPIEDLGPRRKDFTRIAWPRLRRHRGGIQGEVVYVDRFGNAITNLDAGSVSTRTQSGAQVVVNNKWICPLAACYSAVPAGAAVAVLGSSGFLEIAINSGSAAMQFGIRPGDAVNLR